MLPTLTIGSWQISTYGVFFTLAVVVSGIYAFERLRRLGYPPSVVLRGLMLMTLGGAVSTFLAYWILHQYHLAHDELLGPQESTDVFWTLFGGAIVALPYIRRHKAPLGRTLDLGVPALALALAIGRLGCISAGCCYGIRTTSALGLYLPDDQGVWAVRYPTQLLALIANLLIFVTLLAVERYGERRQGQRTEGKTWPFDGFLVLLFILLYSLKRFILAFMRQEGTIHLLGPLSWMHLNALVAGSAAAVLIVWNILRRKERREWRKEERR